MQPYISLITASRNDDHGSGLIKRMRLFISGLIHQCNKHQLPFELIIVEWNPPAGKPLLHEVMPKPADGDFLSLRYVIVPPEVHETYRFAKVIPLYQMIAKNVGIRRARADYILCTNVDLLFSDPLMERLAKRDLRNDCFYRANRCDVPAQLEETMSFDEQVNFCRNNIIRHLGKDPEYLNIHGAFNRLYRVKALARVVNLLMGMVKNTLMDKLE